VCRRAVFRPQKFVFRLRNARVFDVSRRVRVLEIQSCWSAAESADVRLHRDAKDTRESGVDLQSRSRMVQWLIFYFAISKTATLRGTARFPFSAALICASEITRDISLIALIVYLV